MALSVGASVVVILISFIVLYLFGKHVSRLIAGIVLLDVGAQSGHVSNQTRIYSLQIDARSRLNMVYKVCYFSSGALGSYAGSCCGNATAWPVFAGWAAGCWWDA